MAAAILASSVVCCAGRGTEQVWASVRAGLSRIGTSEMVDKNFEPMRMGLVREEALPPLPAELDAFAMPMRARRMLRLAAPVLSAVAPEAGTTPVKLFLGLPELNPTESPWIKGFALHLARLANVQVDMPNSRIVPSGRAASLIAMEIALAALAQDPSKPVIVGGVDSYLDLKLLQSLDAEQRILSAGIMDGFIPGEGAAFLVLSANAPAAVAGQPRPVTLQAAASFADPGHRYGAEPAKGEGLAEAIDLLRGRLTQQLPPIGATLAGFNGESFDAKLWGVARVRHPDFFAPAMTLEHPADCFGDTGAASGAILAALAATALSKNQRNGPALVWAASDHEPRACALLSAQR